MPGASTRERELSPSFFFSPLLESNTAHILFFPWRLTMIEGNLREQRWSGNRIRDATRSIEEVRWTEDEIELVPEIELRRDVQLVL
jgi:hypothetical protein